MTNATPVRSWEVLLLGGAAGTGKTSVSYRLARFFEIGLTEVDDFQIVLETMTTPEQQPLLHYWRTHPEALSWPAKRIVEHSIAVGALMSPALAAVTANHLETRTPLLMEGDFILPALAAQADFAGIANAGQVRAVFLYEDEQAQLLANFSAREPNSEPQHLRAEVSWRYGQWLQHQVAYHGLIALPARPWETLLQRIIAALQV